MIQCPLCNNSAYATLNTYSIKTLGEKWKQNFNFNPFLGQNAGKVLRKNKCTECGLIYYDPPYFGDDKFYEKLSRNKWYYEDEKWEFYEAIKVIEKHQPRSVLEIGCGAGMFLEKISSMVDEVEGFDINEEAVGTCKLKGLNVSIADFTSDEFIKTNNKKYEMIILFEVLEHLRNAQEIFYRIKDLLSDDGLLLIAVPNPEGYFRFIDIVLLDMPPHHNTAWSHNVFEFISNNLGYELIHYNTEPLRYVHYIYYLSTISKLYSINSSRLIDKFINKIASLIVRLMAPFYFASDQQKILGQTHLAVFKNKGGEWPNEPLS